MWIFCDKNRWKFNKNLNRIDTIQQAILSFRLYEWNGLHDWYRTLGGYKMRRFNIIFKQYLQYYLYLLVIVGILYSISPRPFFLGLMIGTCGSLVNTYIFESYLARSMKHDTTHVATGSTWRYAVAIITCLLWFFCKEHINIIGVLIGLMISYIVIILRPLLQRE